MLLTREKLIKDLGYEIKDEIKCFSLYKDGKSVKVLNIPENVEVIGKECFCNLSNIEKVIFPENLKVIDQSAFWGCSYLKEIVFNKNLEFINKTAFSFCNVKALTFPENLKRLGPKACSAIKNLEEVRFLNKNTTIAEGAFEGCLSLKEVNLPDNIKKLEEKTFFNCTNLERIDLKNIEQIEKHVFVNNYKLKEITLPKNIAVVNPQFLTFDYKHMPFQMPYRPKKINMHNVPDKYLEYFKENNFVNVNNISLDFLLDTGKSFKEINSIYKIAER